MSEYTPLWANYNLDPEPVVEAPVPEPKKDRTDFLYAPLDWVEGRPILELLFIPVFILLLPLWMIDYAIRDWNEPVLSGPKRNNSLEMP